MPFRDLDGAARLIERIDEVLALVKGWTLVNPGRVNQGIEPTLRNFSNEDLAAFDDLDARIGGLMLALDITLPPAMQLGQSAPSRQGLRGYTELRLIGRSVDYPSDWSRRLIALKAAAQEVIDVSSREKDQGRSPDSVDVRDLCALLGKRSNKGKSQIDIARSFTHEQPGKDTKAQSLLRQARRFPHLWRSTDK